MTEYDYWKVFPRMPGKIAIMKGAVEFSKRWLEIGAHDTNMPTMTAVPRLRTSTGIFS